MSNVIKHLNSNGCSLPGEPTSDYITTIVDYLNNIQAGYRKVLSLLVARHTSGQCR